MADSEKDVKIRIDLEGDAKKGIDDIAKSDKEFRDGLLKTSAAFTAMAAVGVAAIYKMIEASDAQEQAILKLNAALTQTGENTEAMREKVKNFASNLQQLTGIADERLIPSLSRLAMEFGSMDMAMEALPGLMAAAEIKGVDLNTVIRGTESALNGQTGALSRYGISIEDASSAQSVLNSILSETEKFLPQLGISTETLAGKLRVIGANIRDLLEPFGKAFGDIFLPFADWVRQITVDIGPLVESIALLTAKLMIIATVLLGILATITGLGAAVITMNIAWMAWGETLMAIAMIILAAIGPTGWIIIGITTITGLVLVFRKEIAAVFSFIATGLSELWEFLKSIPFLGLVFEGLEKIAVGTGELLKWIIGEAKPFFDELVSFGKWAAENIYGFFAWAWNGIASRMNDYLMAYDEAALRWDLPVSGMRIPVMAKTLTGALRSIGLGGGGKTEPEAETEATEAYGYKSPAAESAMEGLPGAGAYQQAFSGAYGGTAGTSTIPTVAEGIISGEGSTTKGGTYTEEEISAGISEAGAFITSGGQAQYFAGQINTLWSAYRGLKYEEQVSLGTKNNQATMNQLLGMMADVIKNVQPNIVLNVQGNVTTENDLISNIKQRLKSSQSVDSYSY